MWIVFGILAILFSFGNILVAYNRKDHRLMLGLGLSFTALTVWDFYKQVALWVLSGDFFAIEDVVPTSSKALLFLVLASIVINLLSIYIFNKKKPIQ